MKNSLRLAAAALLLQAASSGPQGCESAPHGFCADAGPADRGLVITQAARIEFEVGEDALRLTIDDTRSGARTVLDLPSAGASGAGDLPALAP